MFFLSKQADTFLAMIWVRVGFHELYILKLLESFHTAYFYITLLYIM